MIVLLTADEDDANLIYKEMERLKPQYAKVAIYFGVPPDILDEIRENNPKNSASAFSDVIKSWVRQEHNVGKFGYPSWRKVVEAAVGAGNKLQAKKIARNHPGLCLYKTDDESDHVVFLFVQPYPASAL